jgi:hypothetical protein
MPPPVHDQLISEGRAKHHRHQHDTSWVTHRLRSVSDVAEALWLLKLAAGIARVGAKGGAADAKDREELAALSPSPALREAIARGLGSEAPALEAAA